ncbi:MAG: hypothetical protein H6829_13245 [Planctomycetes bacterium]|nr:hypothetical protein [Planctomycetota bacterium]MCB9911970.1 hypothetical protein [Planctomycetota bacterium]HPF13258.1 hypothetical protein [Planctomycetota bacterium]HRV81091.1 hypothetical protein [Planctomycetota bacterium]
MKPNLALPLSLPLALLLVLGSCGSANPEETGFEALQAGSYPKAVENLKKAMDAAEAGSDKQRQLGVGYCQALAHTSPTECVTIFLAMAKQGPVQPTERDYETVAGELMQVKAYSEAAQVVDHGMKAYVKNQRLPEFMAKLVTLAKAGDQPGLASTIQGLGYGGGE